MTEEGLEQLREFAGNVDLNESAVAQAVTTDPGLRKLIEVWPELSQADRNAIIAIAVKG